MTARNTRSAPLTTHTGFGDCVCEECWPLDVSDTPLADHGRPLGFWRTLWAVVRGLRIYG